MEFRAVNPESVPEPHGGYVNALQVTGAQRWLYVSGQIPQARDDHVPTDFEGQCRLVWRNVLAALWDADIDVPNLVKVTTFLADRRYAQSNSAVRRAVLGDHRPALTVVVAQIFDPAWLVEIEAVAAA